MIYLFASVMVSCTLSFTLKTAQLKGWDRENITIINYIVAALVSLGICLASGTLSAFREIGGVDFSTLFTPNTPGNSIFFAVVCGVITGALFLLNLRLMDTCIEHSGVGLTTLFNKSGFLVTLTASMLIWGERLSAIRWLGVALTVVALPIAAGVSLGRGTLTLRRPAPMIGTLVCSGILEINNKVFSSYASPEHRSILALVTFVTALTLCTAVMVKKRIRQGIRWRFRWQEICAGVMMGAPNTFSGITQILALATLPAMVVFPALAAGNLLLTTLASILVFKEPLSKRQVIAVALTSASLVLVNL